MPTVIPEINQNQLDILMKSGTGKLTTFWILPDPVKDRPDEFLRFTRSQTDIEDLISIGLLVDSTKDDDNVDQIKVIEEANGRKFRAVSITNYGMAFFGHALGAESNLIH